MRGAISKFFPVANHEMTKAAACMFTTTQDSHFIVDLHPKHKQVLLTPMSRIPLWTAKRDVLLWVVCIDKPAYTSVVICSPSLQDSAFFH